MGSAAKEEEELEDMDDAMFRMDEHMAAVLRARRERLLMIVPT